MQRRFDFEQDIKEALERKCDGLTASQSLKMRIDEEILTRQKEAGKMGHLRIKKTAVVIAAACLLVGGTAFATGRATYLEGHSYNTDAITDYAGMPKAEKELGYPVDSVEQFANGYRFSSVGVHDTAGKDESGDTVYTYKDMMINYDKEGENGIYLAISRPVETEMGRDYVDERVCGDITLYYDENTYKSVPPDYQMTEEDKANEAKGHFWLAYGSREVTVEKATGVTWMKDGVRYELAGFDLGLSADEMFDMAEEVLGQ